MSKKISLAVFLAIVIGFSANAAAQTETRQPESQSDPQPDPQDAQNLESAPMWRITEREVYAVQYELGRRGYYRSKPSGVLDRDTREAVRKYQSESGLKVTGRIDRTTYESLELPYPATGKESDNERRNGVLPKIGYTVKDKTVATTQTVTGAAGTVKNKTQAGVEKTWETGSGAVSKTKEVAQGVGDTTVRTARTVTRETQKAGNALVGRSDAVIHREVRETLAGDPETEKWQTEVKTGLVTIKTPPQHKADIGEVIAKIRKVPGVKSVFVIAQ